MSFPDNISNCLHPGQINFKTLRPNPDGDDVDFVSKIFFCKDIIVSVNVFIHLMLAVLAVDCRSECMRVKGEGELCRQCSRKQTQRHENNVFNISTLGPVFKIGCFLTSGSVWTGP